MRGVEFAYVPGAPVLTGFDLSVSPGEHVALVGPSGVGKTTAVELFQGFLHPDAGTVRVAGVDLDAAPADWASSQIAMVAQHTYLFAASLRDNLLLARPEANDADIWAALRQAHLEEFVRSLPAGLDTGVGERGLALSGGQAQRLAIARAFLKDAPILILDEPTSQVDLASEHAITQSLEQLAQGRTVLTVSHRPSLIASASRICRLDKAASATSEAAQ
jgi:ATP-binding cassette subfamily C protein CydD